MQRVLFYQVEKEVVQFKTYESVPGLYHIQLSLGVAVCVVDEVVIREIPAAHDY